ncbi:glycosyltransferase family 61 protein [Roseomonas sp. PWR1]|uniref:Glycosyltransferase family 61 protein n=2 Tax=Roseomonas nitratireducens TaxID=2820810 RepID=A0ABS4AQR8_9PROT|nr:glycosyltransferase family 61 protein [Neoroseomonas nitratireducens]
MSEAGDIAGIARRLADIPPADQLPGLVPLHVAAAIELRDADAIAASVAAAIAAPLAPRMRALMAWRLAVAGHAAEAWAVLHSDPAILPAEDARGAVLQLLGRIGNEASARPDLRLAARTLAARLASTPAEVQTHPAPFAYVAGDAQPRPGGAPPEIVAAPGLRPHVLAAFAKQAETFEGMIAARRRPLEVRAHHDVFINRFGQVWRSEGGLLGHLLRGVEQPLPAASLDAMSTAPAVEEAVFAVEQFNNMFHWVADALPSIAWRFAPGVPPVPLAMQPDAAPYKAEALAVLAGGEPPPILPAGDALFVRRLYFGPFGAHTIAPLGAHRDLIGSIADAADASPAPADGLPPLLYISRRDAAKRALGNEAALEEALAARGFGVRLFSGRGFLEQVRLIRGARVIVAPHGAALGLLLFAHAGTAVFEVMPGMAQAAGLRFCMARLSRLLALRHRIWLEPINALTGAWAASLDPLLADLDAWLR